MSIQKKILLTGCVLGGLSVLIGAFGAHALKAILLENQRVETFELAVRYQFYHTLAILVAGLAALKLKTAQLRLSFLFFLGGILLFSGSLYAYALTNNSLFAMVTPFGGAMFLGGWIMLGVGIWKSHE